MIHQPAAAFYEAQAGEFVMEAEELLKLREIITKVYVQRTGKPLWVVSEDLERDVFMSATEAQTHGIVDLVAVQWKKKGFRANPWFEIFLPGFIFIKLNKMGVIHNHRVRIDLNQLIMYTIQHANY